MTYYSELIARARSPFSLTERDAQEIADALEAQAKEIAKLEADDMAAFNRGMAACAALRRDQQIGLMKAYDRIAELEAALKKEAVDKADDERLFSGVSFGAFDGTVQVADLRGSLPEIKLILSAGKKQIDCICRSDDIEKIRAALNRRVRVFGRAIYDGKSELPRRLEVVDFQSIKGEADFTRWRGSFWPFEIDDWDNDA